jgi:hypothetical protein
MRRTSEEYHLWVALSQTTHAGLVTSNNPMRERFITRGQKGVTKVHILAPTLYAQSIRITVTEAFTEETRRFAASSAGTKCSMWEKYRYVASKPPCRLYLVVS